MEIKSNFNDVLINIEKDIENKIGGVAMTRMLNDISVGLLRTMKRRIHSNGETTGGSSIGSYSTDPMYANPKNGAISVSLPNQGKRGETTFKNGKEHKTRYYSSGYKGWREANRRITSKVNLVFKGDLNRSFTFVKLSDFVFGIGFTDDENYQKAKGLEQHFNVDIWGVGEAEQKIIDDTIDLYVNKL